MASFTSKITLFLAGYMWMCMSSTSTLGQDMYESYNKKSEGFKVGAHVNLLRPISVLSDYFGSGFGAGLQAKYIVKGIVGLGTYAHFDILRPRLGVTSFGVSNSLMSYGGFFEYYFDQTGNGVFIGSDVGYYRLSSRVAANVGGAPVSATTNTSNYLGVAPMLGYVMDTPRNLSYFGTIKYIIVPGDMVPNGTTQSIYINVGVLLGL